jgi:RNA polymerase sigma factor (sigma-70 family)
MQRRARLVALDGGKPRGGVNEPRAFEEFFEIESPALYRRLCLITGNRQEAEEAMQDAFISLFERWERISEMENPTGYLYRTAFREVNKRARRAARRVRELAHVPSQGDEFAVADDRETVRRALGVLTRRQRMAIVLTDLLGYPSEEAGMIMGTRPVTVRVLASQGRAAMARIVGDLDA